MKIERSKEWWINFIKDEPDCPIGAGVPDPVRAAGPIGLVLLRLRAKLAFIWRLGLIRRPTAFRWEMDALLGEWS